jgi:hypothetical protein
VTSVSFHRHELLLCLIIPTIEMLNEEQQTLSPYRHKVEECYNKVCNLFLILIKRPSAIQIIKEKLSANM